MKINVLVAFSNQLFSDGIKRILEDYDEVDGIEVLRPGTNPFKAMESQKTDVVLVDFATLCNEFGGLGQSHSHKLLLFDTCCTEVDVITALLTKGLKGVIAGTSTPASLKKAIRAVCEGEVWLDRVSIKNLLAGMHSLKKDPGQALSDREWEVTSLVGQGLRNKEIAEKLCISEPTVKTHMQRIFQKLDIRNRPQLITFAIKKRNDTREGR